MIIEPSGSKEQQMDALGKVLGIICEATEGKPKHRVGGLRILRVATKNTLLFFYIAEGAVQHHASFSWN